MSHPPPLQRVLETALHVDNLALSRAWYERIFGLRAMIADDRICAFDVSGRSVLLLFQRGSTLEPVVLPGGVIPPHDGSGHLHFAFAVDAADLAQWEAWLAGNEVPIYSRFHWPLGGTSIYFHDLDGHVLELATPGLWPTY